MKCMCTIRIILYRSCSNVAIVGGDKPLPRFVMACVVLFHHLCTPCISVVTMMQSVCHDMMWGHSARLNTILLDALKRTYCSSAWGPVNCFRVTMPASCFLASCNSG